MSFADVHYTGPDGLRLYARDYGARLSKATPVVCLPGLTRNAKDFHDLAEHLATGRRVLCPDLRGRGRSAYAQSWSDYTPQRELDDTLALMAAAGLHQAIIIGTSRGGMIAMLMGSQRPTAIKGVVLNDIGPELAPEGIKRIMSYAGRMRAPPSWKAAGPFLKEANGAFFPELTDDEWDRFARKTFADEDGAPIMDYDPEIGTAIRRTFFLNVGQRTDLWRMFASLTPFPTLLIRGENSDLLSEETAERMATAHPRMSRVTARGRGHAPFLDEPEVVTAIDQFIAGLE